MLPDSVIVLVIVHVYVYVFLLIGNVLFIFSCFFLSKQRQKENNIISSL